jgi:periplasmic protein TonB
MSAATNHSPDYGRRRSHVLLPALMVSAALHVVAGSLGVGGLALQTVAPPMAAVLVVIPAVVDAGVAPAAGALHLPRQAAADNLRQRAADVLPASPATMVAMTEKTDAVAPMSAPVAEPVAAAPADSASTANVTVMRAVAAVPATYPAEYLNVPRVSYPPLARKLGLEGLVVVRVRVSAVGKPEHAEITQTSGAQLLDEAALAAVRGATFKPRSGAEGPFVHVVDAPIRFRLP